MHRGYSKASQVCPQVHSYHSFLPNLANNPSAIKSHSFLPDALMSVRHSLVTSKMSGATSPIQRPALSEHCFTLYASIKSGLEASLTNVREFIGSTVSFSMRHVFRREFCMNNVRSGIVMTFISYVLETCGVR